MTDARDLIAEGIFASRPPGNCDCQACKDAAVKAFTARLAAAGLSITATPEGFPVSSIAVARVAQQIIGEEPRMVSSVWASNLLVELLEGRADV